MCLCPVGMEVGPDNKTCQIQSFCAKHLKCSQRCIQDKFNVKCACYEGWALDTDKESCYSTGKDTCVCERERESERASERKNTMEYETRNRNIIKPAFWIFRSST